MASLRDKVVVITGAAGGIGRALCLELAAHGCRLGLLSRTPEKLDELTAELRLAGASVLARAVDIGNRVDVEKAIAELQRDLGPTDVLIHNAGIARTTNARAPDLDDLEAMLSVNCLGGIYALGAVLPGMLERGRGQVVAISTLSARRGLAWTAGYSASKAAFATYLESLRPALRQRGIRVCTIFPGFVRTPMSAALPFRLPVLMLTPAAAAKKIIRAIVQGRRELSFPWYEAWLMEVFRRMPAWALDWCMANVGRFILHGEY
jgi:short-subunit dehydrogenase